MSSSPEAVPAKYFAVPPYRVEPARADCADGLWYVSNANGVNCLTFPDKPGACFTSKIHAEAICEMWNQNS